jgi:hypothetical protein
MKRVINAIVGRKMANLAPEVKSGLFRIGHGGLVPVPEGKAAGE